MYIHIYIHAPVKAQNSKKRGLLTHFVEILMQAYIRIYTYIRMYIHIYIHTCTSTKFKHTRPRHTLSLKFPYVHIYVHMYSHP